MYIVGVDPGVTAGVAAIQFLEGEPFRRVHGLCQVKTAVGWGALVKEVA